MKNKYQIIHLYINDGRIIEAVAPPFLEDNHKVEVTKIKVFPPRFLPEDCSWTKLEEKPNDDKLKV